MSPTISGNVNDSPPSTPPRGRLASRYPQSLTRGDPGRVPLHRRGTSKTYERLEDLLREAGYKETRIFTPESERKEAREEERQKGSMRGGVDSLMGYLASWVPGSGRVEGSTYGLDAAEGHTATPHEGRLHWSLPPSPLAHKRKFPNERGRPSSPLSTSPNASPTASTMTVASSHSPGGPTANYRHLTKHVDQPAQLLRPKSSASGNLRTYAQVSAAQGYLRHMASAPNIPKHRPSTGDTSADRLSVYVRDRGLPDLPPRWLESVTKAVASTSHPYAHVGGPQTARHLSRAFSRAPGPRQNKSTLSDQTNRPVRSASRAPSGLTACMARAEAAPSAVSTARVMCRSAPSSRSSSCVGKRSDRSSASSESRKVPSRRQSRSDGVPSLARTSVENDAWGMHWVDGQRVPMLVVNSARDDALDSGSDDNDDDDDEDDGELTFARLLVPPKRQYSIQSLRKHLHQSQSRGNLRDQESPWDEDEEDFGSRGRSRRNTAEDEDSEGWQAFGVPSSKNGTVKRRSGLPGGWANFTGRS